jgi:hypothetical protein
LGSDTPQYLLSLNDEFVIPKTFNASSPSLFVLRTGYFDLDDSRLRKNIERLDIMFAQVASGFVEKQVWLHHVYPPIPISQEVRSYLIMARQADNNERWIRIGLATVAKYESDIALYGAHTGTMSWPEKQKTVQDMTMEQIKKKVEDKAYYNRKIFQRFDDAATLDFVLY